MAAKNKSTEKILLDVIPPILAIILFLIFMALPTYIVLNHQNFCLPPKFSIPIDGTKIDLSPTFSINLPLLPKIEFPFCFSIGQNELINIEPIFFSIAFVLISVLLILNLKEFKKQFSEIRKETWILLLLILLLGFYLRGFVVPHTHRIFFDEDLYSGIANSMATEGRNILCNYGTPTHCMEGILNKDPSGWPFFISVFYRIFGSGESLAFHISTAIGTLSILLVFLIVFSLFKNYKDKRNEEIALFAALLFSLTPAHIIWSGSVATEVPFAFFSLMTILAYLLYFKNEKFRSHLLGASLLAFTVQIRPEGFLFIAVIIFTFLLFEKNWSKKLTNFRFWIPWVLFFLFITPHLIHIYINREGEWGAPSGKKFGFEYAINDQCLKGNLNTCIALSNLPKNSLFWFSGIMHPAFFPLSAIIGFLYLLSEREKQKILLFNIFWFLLFFILFILFYAGGVDNGGIGFRFVNIYFVPTVILGGYGAFVLTKLLIKLVKNKFITLFILLTIILISFYFTLPFILVPDKQAQYARDMHDILVMPNMDSIPENCYVLNHNPSIFLVEGKNSLQTWFGQNDGVMNDVFARTDCVMFLEGAWCLFPPHKDTVCKTMHDKYKLEIFARHIRKENSEQVFTIYRVYRK